MRIDRFEDIPACASMADREAYQLAREQLARSKVNERKVTLNVEPAGGQALNL